MIQSSPLKFTNRLEHSNAVVTIKAILQNCPYICMCPIHLEEDLFIAVVGIGGADDLTVGGLLEEAQGPNETPDRLFKETVGLGPGELAVGGGQGGPLSGEGNYTTFSPSWGCPSPSVPRISSVFLCFPLLECLIRSFPGQDPAGCAPGDGRGRDPRGLGGGGGWR